VRIVLARWAETEPPPLPARSTGCVSRDSGVSSDISDLRKDFSSYRMHRGHLARNCARSFRITLVGTRGKMDESGCYDPLRFWCARGDNWRPESQGSSCKTIPRVPWRSVVLDKICYRFRADRFRVQSPLFGISSAKFWIR
jgi:hypothetical protein